MRTSTTIHAGSMADVAFLLLIFFLTTTTMETDSGLPQILPEPCTTKDCIAEIVQRNLYTIVVNAQGDYLINNQKIEAVELKTNLIHFVRNPHQLATQPRLEAEAIIGIKISRSLDYAAYVKVLDLIKQAYAQMREETAMQRYGTSLSKLKESQRQQVLKTIPLNLAEATPE